MKTERQGEELARGTLLEELGKKLNYFSCKSFFTERKRCL